MDNTAPRMARLQAIRDRWFTEPLATTFPSLGAEALLPDPTTCDELVRSARLSSAFSSLHDAPDAAGMTADAALAHDRATNAQRFGVEDPKTVMQELSRQFDRAPSGQVDPEVLKKSFVVLDVIREGSSELAEQAPAPVQAAHRADAEAVAQAQQHVAALASELGISLPVNRGVRRNK